MIAIAGGILLALLILAIWPYLLMAITLGGALLWLSSTELGQSHPNPIVYVVLFYGVGGVLVLRKQKRDKAEAARRAANPLAAWERDHHGEAPPWHLGPWPED